MSKEQNNERRDVKVKDHTHTRCTDHTHSIVTDQGYGLGTWFATWLG